MEILQNHHNIGSRNEITSRRGTMKRLIASIAVSGFALVALVSAAAVPLVGDATPAFADTSETTAAEIQLTDMGVFVLEELDYELPISHAKRQNRSVVTIDVTENGVFVLEGFDYGVGAGSGISQYRTWGSVLSSMAMTDRGVFVLEGLDYVPAKVIGIGIPEHQNRAGWSSELTDRGVFVLEELG